MSETSETVRHGNIFGAMAAVMNEVQGVAKRDRNNQGSGFNFRGIDAVLNAVGPALRKHGVIVVPSLVRYEYGTVVVGKQQTQMAHAQVEVDYVFHGPDGSTIVSRVPGEAFDSGDKATAKAMSVAFRTCLIQALALPTDEPDPDSVSYERSPASDVLRNDLITEIARLAKAQDRVDEVLAKWSADHDGAHIRSATDADMADLQALRTELAETAIQRGTQGRQPTAEEAQATVASQLGGTPVEGGQ